MSRLEQLLNRMDDAGHVIVRRFERLDGQPLKKPQRLDNGFLRVEGRLARVGIQEYYDGSGKMLRELRLPEDVFDPKSLESFQQVPVTNTHPPVLLDANNTSKYSVGSVGEDIRRDGDFMVARMMITDASAIAAAEAGRSQLSNGYTCWLDSTQDPELVAKWGPYDLIQRDIRGNHVALVDFARAGPEARLRLDAGDAATGNMAGQEISIAADAQVGSSAVTNHDPHGSRHTMIKFTLDGYEIEVQDANAKSVIERAVSSAKKDSADQLAAARAELDAANKKIDAHKADHAELKSKHDKLDAQVAIADAKMMTCPECDGKGEDANEAKCKGCDGEGKVPFKKIADNAAHITGVIERKAIKLAEIRSSLIDQAKGVLGEGAKFDGKTIVDIKRECVEKLGVKADGKDEVFVTNVFDALMQTRTQGSAINDARRVIGGRSDNTAHVVVEQGDAGPGGFRPQVEHNDARATMLKKNADAFLKPGKK